MESKLRISQLEAEQLEELRTTQEHLDRQNQELRASHAELERERARYRELFDFAPEGYLVTDLNGRIQEANIAAGRLLRQDRAWLLQLPLLQFVVPEDQPKLRDLLSRFGRDRAPAVQQLELSLCLPGQQVTVPCSLMVNAVRGSAGPLVGLRWLVRDITNRKQTEEALRQSEQKFRLLVEEALVGVYIVQNGRFTYVNPMLAQIFGYPSPQAIVSQPISSLVAEADRPKVTELLRRREAREIAQAHYTFQGLRQDSTLIDVEVLGALMTYQGKPAVIGTLVDITERKQHALHLERTVDERTAKLREAMAELEHMSYSMIHDMRAPLRAMQSFASLAEQECAGCTRLRGHEYFRRIRDASNRLDRLITDALNYNKVVRQDLPAAPTHLARLLRGMLDTYPNLLPAQADIQLEFQDLVVLANESLLTQCFGNLLSNAVKFVAPGVRPRIRVWAEPGGRSGLVDNGTDAPVSSTHPPIHPSINPSINPSTPFVRVWVEDNGIGIPKEFQERLFGMFHRMHREEEYPGTGIGLAIVKKAVERMGGRLGLQSEPGQGSRFWVDLPLAR